MLQKSEEPRVRLLHSHLLLSNVLQERDKQLEYKVHKLNANRIHEKEEVLKLRLQHLQALDKENEKNNNALLNRLEFAAGLRSAAEEKQNKKADVTV
jgi:hypothetical protein